MSENSHKSGLCMSDRVLDWPWGAGREKVHCLGRHSECTPAGGCLSITSTGALWPIF